VIQSVTLSSPAAAAGIKPGMIVESLNNEPINGLDEFTSVIQNSSHDAPVGITILTYDYDAGLGKSWFIMNPNITSIALVDKWDYYEQNLPSSNDESYKGISYMGVGSTVFGVAPVDSDYASKFYAEAFSGDALTSSINFISLPLRGLSPIEGPLSTLYEPTGMLTDLPNDVYWVLINSVYWIFWINLMVGLTNALPAVPLDGGYVFRDMLKGIFERINAKRLSAAEAVRKKLIAEADADRYISVISLTISVFILFLILWQLVGPRLF